MTKGSAGRGLILSAMGGQISHDHDAVKFSDEKKKAAPSFHRSSLTQQRKGDSRDCVTRSTTVAPISSAHRDAGRPTQQPRDRRVLGVPTVPNYEEVEHSLECGSS